jgi:hypothetical protein
MTGDHEIQRARLLAAMARGPITSKDFATSPAIDGGDEIPRVAARMLELRAAGHDIPRGRKDEHGFAIYELAHHEPVVEFAPDDELKSCGLCHGCLGSLHAGESCERGGEVEAMSYWDPFGPPEFGCRKQVVEVAHAA